MPSGHLSSFSRRRFLSFTLMEIKATEITMCNVILNDLLAKNSKVFMLGAQFLAKRYQSSNPLYQLQIRPSCLGRLVTGRTMHQAYSLFPLFLLDILEYNKTSKIYLPLLE